MRLQLGRGTHGPGPSSMVPAALRSGERPTGVRAVRRRQRPKRRPISLLIDRDPLHLQAGRLRPPRLARLELQPARQA